MSIPKTRALAPQANRSVAHARQSTGDKAFTGAVCAMVGVLTAGLVTATFSCPALPLFAVLMIFLLALCSRVEPPKTMPAHSSEGRRIHTNRNPP